MSLTTVVLIGVLGLFGIGLYGLLASLNLIKVIVALQIMVKGVMILLVLAGRYVGQVSLGESMAITLIVADTIVAVLGLALAVQVRRHVGNMDLQSLTKLRR